MHINRALREAGLLAVREELGTDSLDAGASEAFAVADHQVAHVYVRDRNRIAAVKTLLEQIPGVETVFDRDGQRPSDSITSAPANLSRSPMPMPGSPITTGSTIGARRTSRARSTSTASPATTRPSCSSIRHRCAAASCKIAWKLPQKMLGFRYLMDVIPLDATLVRGSHGRPTEWLEARSDISVVGKASRGWADARHRRWRCHPRASLRSGGGTPQGPHPGYLGYPATELPSYLVTRNVTLAGRA